MFSINFKSAGHAFATFFKAAKADLIKLEPFIVKVEAAKPEVEVLTGIAVGAVQPAAEPVALGIEDAAFAVLGELAAALNAGGAAAEANLLNAGLDQNVINTVKSVVSGSKQVAVLVKAATK